MSEPVGAAVKALGDGFDRWVWSGRTISDVQVSNAEEEVGAAFPEDYRRFVVTSGCAAIIRASDGMGLEFYGLARSCPTPLDVRRRRCGFAAGGRTDLIPAAGAAGGQPRLAFDAAGRWYRVNGSEVEAVDGGFVSEALRLLEALVLSSVE